MNKINLYIYPHAQPHVHDSDPYYINTVPLSYDGIKTYCNIVPPEKADYFYMGQITNDTTSSNSITLYDKNKFPFFEGNEDKHILDYEGEGGQEYGAGGHPIPNWLHNSIITINGPLKRYSNIKRMFIRPTFSHMLVDLKDKHEKFTFPDHISMGFRGFINHNVRVVLANTLNHFKDIKNELYINQKWEGPSKTNSDIQKQYRDTMQNNLISLCPRGSGIDSTRLFESCYFTRVPVLISDHDFFIVGEDYYDTSFFYRICNLELNSPGNGETLLYNELAKIQKIDINELRERATLARKYFDVVLRKYFEDPTLYFLKWLKT
tara:strand:+ start:512 stop:1474 length:963 start_codon:yes stop_codon:yes gene_type:complete